MINVEIKGTDLVIRGLRAASEKALQGVADGIEESCNVIANEAARGHPKRGEREKNATGRVPNPDGSYRYFDRSTNLTGSIKAEKDIKPKAGRVEGKIEAGGFTKGPGSQVVYASFVEFGDSKRPAYPFMRPAVEAKKYEIPGLIEKNVARALR